MLSGTRAAFSGLASQALSDPHWSAFTQIN